MPCPHALCGAGPSEVAPSVRLPVRRVHLALRRCSQRPSIDRMALDFRQSSFRHVTRVSPSPGFSVFSPLSALPAGSCPLALSSLGKPLTQGSPLNPSHLRWGCCMNYCGTPDAGGSQLHAWRSAGARPRATRSTARRPPHDWGLAASSPHPLGAAASRFLGSAERRETPMSAPITVRPVARPSSASASAQHRVTCAATARQRPCRRAQTSV